MIVFTLTNTISGQVYVGTTRDAPEQRWAQFCQAAADGVEADLYSDIRHCGEAAFELQEWAVADSLPELRQLTEEALQEYQAINLHGIRTRVERSGGQWLESTTSGVHKPSISNATATIQASAAPQPRAAATPASPRSILKAPTSARPKASGSAGASNKMPTGRASSSSKEKKVREGIEAERLARQSEERARQLAQADEMAAIMARIDQRSKR